MLRDQYHYLSVRDEESEAQRSEVTRQAGEAWIASRLRWGPQNRKVGQLPLNPGCKGSPWGAK